MRIKEVEEMTGISCQNIRYYEKQGLLYPVRNPENAYREYNLQDVERLKQIKLFRKLDIPIEEIRKVLDGERKLGDTLTEQKCLAKEKKNHLEAVVKFYDRIEETELSELHADPYLSQMEEQEKKGDIFAGILEDFRIVAQAEALREFSFRPDTMCRNSREFTDALCQYARESGKDLVITKEGMYPEFTMDGIEYTAYRYFSRWGAVVQCTMKYPEQAGDGKISGKRKLIMRFLIRSLVPVLVFLVIALPRVEKPSQLIALLPLGAAYLILLKFSYGNFREKGH